MLSWVHRDRLQQTDDFLISDSTGDVGPEPGTTYRVVVEGFNDLDASTAIAIDEDVGSATSLDLSSVPAANVTDLPINSIRAEYRVYSYRDGYECWRPIIQRIFTEYTTGLENIWTPAQIDTELWLSGDIGPSGSQAGLVTTWADRSGKGRDFLSSSQNAPRSNINRINGRPLVTFSGTGQYMYGSTTAEGMLSGVSQVSIFALVFISDFVDENSVIDFVRNDISKFKVRSTVSKFIASRQKEGSATLSETTSLTAVSNDWFLINAQMDLASGSMELFVNAVSEDTNATLDTGATSSTVFDRIRIGRIALNFGSAQYFQGDIAEIVVISGDVTAATRQKVEGFMAWKWGFAQFLPVGHPYESTPPQVT